MRVKRRISNIVMVLAALSFSANGYQALGIEVAGKNFPQEQRIGDASLKLIGAGVREKFFFKVYALAAYSQTPICNPQEIINKDETKYLRLEILRNLTAKQLSDSLKESFSEQMSSSDVQLSQQVKEFLGYFTSDLKAGSRIELSYEPNFGVKFMQDGQLRGQIPGHAFAKALWSIYFGEQTCCADLKSQLMKTCVAAK